MKKTRAFTTVKAGHRKVRGVWISERDRDREEMDGYYSHYKSIIGIYGGLTASIGVETLIHELLHMVNAMAGITDHSMPKTEEELVVLQTQHVATLVADNPEHGRWLFEAVHSPEPNIRGAWNKRRRRK